MISARNITKIINGRRVLDGVSMTLRPGEIVSIIGPSGAGKTILLKILSLLEYASTGSVKIDNNEYMFPLERRDKIDFPYPSLTVVFQQLFIWPHLTIRQNLDLPLRGDADGDFYKSLVNRFEMKSFLDRFPNEASLGQRQRAALVRALLLKPKYLLLDEVTSALDIEQSINTLNYLREIADRGTGIIFVSHALQFVKKISDKVIFVDDGKIVESGGSGILNKPQTGRFKKFISVF